jgi:hypothetical protein
VDTLLGEKDAKSARAISTNRKINSIIAMFLLGVISMWTQQKKERLTNRKLGLHGT